jgi:hypothetical protein
MDSLSIDLRLDKSEVILAWYFRKVDGARLRP